jgi:hypothetical protein
MSYIFSVEIGLSGKDYWRRFCSGRPQAVPVGQKKDPVQPGAVHLHELDGLVSDDAVLGALRGAIDSGWRYGEAVVEKTSITPGDCSG